MDYVTFTCINIKHFKDEKKAHEIINCAKEANVLEVLLKKYFYNDVIEELSRKQESQYVYNNKIIISAFAKYKRNVDANKDLQNVGDKNRKILKYYIFSVCVVQLTVVSLVIFGIFGLERRHRAMMIPAIGAVFGIVVAVGLILCLYSSYNEHVVNKSCKAPTVAWLRGELAAEQKSQLKTTVDVSVKPQEGEEQQADKFQSDDADAKPETSIETQMYPDLSDEFRQIGLEFR